MRATFNLFIFAFLLISCGETHTETADRMTANSTEDFWGDGSSGHKVSKTTRQIFDKFINGPEMKKHDLVDARTGLVVSSTEYPADWQVISKPSYTIDQKLPTFLVQVTGPGHLQSFNTPITFHMNYEDPQMVQYLANSPFARMIRPLAHPEQLFREEVEPRLRNSGFRFLNTRDFPEATRFLRNKVAESAPPGSTRVATHNSEWKNEAGQKALATLSVVSMRQPTLGGYGVVWFYSVTYTFVDENAYESTVEAFEQALFSTRENPQWTQYVSQLNQQRALENEQKMRIAAQQHQARMDAKWAAFNAHQESMRAISAAQDANHASFMNRNFGPGSDTGQRQFINMINEQETVYNPLTGSNYQVNAGSTEYWMDSNGNYIENNDLFYTPNGDINLNNREWVKVGSAY